MPPTGQVAAPPRIVIAGGGFGGLYTAMHLARRLRRARRDAAITLIDRNNYFLFTPLLHEVVAGMVEMRHVVHPIRRFLRGTPVTFLEADIEKIDLARQTIVTSQGAVPYDQLILALGSETNTFGMTSVAQHCFYVKTMADAFRLRNHVISMFEEASITTDPARRRALLTFVLVGAGCTGVETLTELHDLTHATLLKDYPGIRHDDVRFVLVEALDGVQCPSDRALGHRVARHLARHQIELRFCTRVVEAGPGWLAFADGTRLATHTVIWAAGIRAHPLLAALPVERDRQGRVCVAPTLQLPAHPTVFVLGDGAHVDDGRGGALPTTAQVAIQQAPVVAENLCRLLAGRPLRAFRYRHLGELSSLGARTAVAHVYGLRLFGFAAWWLWRSVYLAKMPGWGEKARIAADWTLDLFFPRDTSRIEVAACAICPAGHARPCGDRGAARAPDEEGR